MSCRRIVDGNVVWFGRAGKSLNGNYIKVDGNYSTEGEAVIDSLTQRLSVLEHELWYDITYGVPIQEKLRSKEIIDAAVLDIIHQHDDVMQIVDFESSVDPKTRSYKCSFTVESTYGLLDITL